MADWRYEILTLLVLKNISRVSALKEKFRISARPCNIHCLLYKHQWNTRWAFACKLHILTYSTISNHWFCSISFNLGNLGKIFFGTVGSLSKFRKESDNFCVVFTYTIKQACEISKFHVVVVQQWQRNVQNSVMHVRSCCLLL